MADEVRCPMCGKLNPADHDVCQFCDARLTPLVVKPSGDDLPVESSLPQDSFGSQSPGETRDLSGASPEWLDTLRAEGSQDLQPEQDELTEEETSEVTHDVSDMPDWLADLRQEDESDHPPVKRSLDTFALDPDHIEDERPGEIPEWLQEFAEPEQPQVEPAQPEDFEDEQDSPEWLRRIRSRYQEEAPPTDEPGPDADAEAFLSRIRSEESEEDQQQAELSSGEPPDWGLIPGSGATAPLDENDLPTWLHEEAEEAQEQPSSVQADHPGDSEHPTGAAEDEPEWLAQLAETAAVDETPYADHEPATDDRATADEDKTGAGEIASASGDVEVVAPFTFDDGDEDLIDTELPAWLSKPAGQGEEEPAREDGEGELKPAHLPGWLAAMRPIEAVTPDAPVTDQRDQKIESSGPLSGLRGVLPAEPDVARRKKPVSYSLKLQVSESHQAHAALLEELIRTETEVRPLPERSLVSPQHFLRWTIFSLLLLAVLVPAFLGTSISPLPTVTPPEVAAMRQIINSLPGDGQANVLLAVDYEPGASGEMNAAAASVLDHLMIKGAFLSIVSTTPSGPAQAEQLIRTVNQSVGHDYRPEGQYLNLGYIPGGVVGLQGFAQSPRAVMPYAINGSAVWQETPLSSIEGLSDFDMILVLAHDPDTARLWVEQVQPGLENTPFTMVLSAQAEPLIRAYYAGRPQQVNGIVSGIAGGAAYENGMPRTSLARKYWDAFSLSVFIVVVLIIVGGLSNTAYYLIKGRKLGKRDA